MNRKSWGFLAVGEAINPLLIILSLLTLAVLVSGIVVMAKGGEASLRYSNKLMSLRVAFQAAAIGTLFLLAIFAGKS